MDGGSAVEFDAGYEERFRLKLRAWLEENAPKPAEDGGAPRMIDHRVGKGVVEKSRRWQRLLFDAGYAGITWPSEFGGGASPPIIDLILKQELERANVPTDKVFQPSLTMFGPTILAFGSEQQKRKHLKAMLRGDEVWCQLFSEPNAGSDLAAVATGVVRENETFIINGQKTWSSRAQYADFGMLVARSDSSVAKHKGISCLIVDMNSPGIEVRSIRQMDGGESFCEVFFTDVHVPIDALLGSWNDGWGIAQRTLMHERFTLGGRGRDGGLPDLILSSHKSGVSNDSSVRQEIASIFILTKLMQFLQLQLESAARQNLEPGPEGSIAKLLYGELVDRSTSLGMSLLGPFGLETGGTGIDPYGYWQSQFLGAPSVHIAGGTDEILRNIIGERLLGLPREPRN